MILERAVALSVALGTVSCGGREGTLVGVSSPRAAERAPGVADAATAAPWTAASDFRSRLSRISERFVSRGHAERFDAIVWGDDASRTLGDAGADFAEGTMFVEEALVPGADAGGLGLLMMEKRAGAWRFAALSPEGEMASDSRVAPCTDCHREAPRDFVFRTPAPAASEQQRSR
jgi:hypothetical protein